MGVEKTLQLSLFISETIRDRLMLTIESKHKIADRSVSISMTLNDLERQDAKGGNTCREGVCYSVNRGHTRFSSYAGSAPASLKFWDPLPTPTRFDLQQPNLVW